MELRIAYITHLLINSYFMLVTAYQNNSVHESLINFIPEIARYEEFCRLPCSSVKVNQHFRRPYRLHFQGRKVSEAKKPDWRKKQAVVLFIFADVISVPQN
jgi:hypothetical protein